MYFLIGKGGKRFVTGVGVSVQNTPDYTGLVDPAAITVLHRHDLLHHKILHHTDNQYHVISYSLSTTSWCILVYFLIGKGGKEFQVGPGVFVQNTPDYTGHRCNLASQCTLGNLLHDLGHLVTLFLAKTDKLRNKCLPLFSLP